MVQLNCDGSFGSNPDDSRSIFGFCPDTQRLVDAHELLRAATAHSLPGLGVCWSRDELLQTLREEKLESGAAAAEMGEKESQNRM